MLATNIVFSGVRVLSLSMGRICNLTTAHQNLLVNLRDAFMMGSKEVDIHSGSWPCSTMWLATYLIKVALWARSLIRALSQVYPNLCSNSVVVLGSRNSGPIA